MTKNPIKITTGLFLILTTWTFGINWLLSNPNTNPLQIAAKIFITLTTMLLITATFLQDTEDL